MMSALNVGSGQCRGAARLLIKPLQAVIELGASRDVLSKVLNTVHHSNRNGSPDDYIGIALPAMRMGRNCMMPGHEIELIGSEMSLSALLKLEGLDTLRRRGMLTDLVICETYSERGQKGAAYVRDRASEKHTPGWIRRSKARAQRRGKPLGESGEERSNDLTTLALICGSAVLHIREVIGEIVDSPIMVSTYGFSSSRSPAILPVMPESLRERGHAI